MTIRKGQDWGSLVVPGPGMPTVSSDAELRELVLAARLSGEPLPVVGLLGGDLMRTLGGTGDPSRLAGDEPIPHVPVDIVHVTADDDRRSSFVAHLLAKESWIRGGWWRGRVTAVMNAQFVGNLDVAPRSHPNDGRMDLVTADESLGLQQRWMARRRLPLGTHLPHPQIAARQGAEASVDLGRATPIRLDGQPWGRATRLQLTVEADAIVVCV